MSTDNITDNTSDNISNITSTTTAEKVSKRDQVLALLQDPTKKYTREEIATILETSVASISSQFTYLRWMGHFIIFDENKKLSLVTKEEYDAWVAARAGKAKKAAASKSTKSPAQQAASLAKTIATQVKQQALWATRLEQVAKDLIAEPNNALLRELELEARAQVDLLTVKLRRNNAKLAELPEPTDTDVDTEPNTYPGADTDVDVEDDLSEDEEDIDIV